MKLSRADFKDVIKECIKELIKEGAFNKALKECVMSSVPDSDDDDDKMNLFEISKPSKISSIDKQIQTNAARAAARRMVSVDNEKSLSEDYHVNNSINPALQHLIENTAHAIGKGNEAAANTYAEIFADTAMNTIPNQMANDSNRQGYGALAAPGAGQMQERVDPRELQSLAKQGDVTHWAKLAFGKFDK